MNRKIQKNRKNTKYINAMLYLLSIVSVIYNNTMCEIVYLLLLIASVY